VPAVSVDEIFEGRDGTWTVSQGRSYTRQFRVIMNEVTDGPAEAISVIGIERGDPYVTINALEQDPNSYVQTMRATQEEGDALGWIVTVEYGWYDSNEAGGGPTQNPLLMPIDVAFSFRDYQVVCDRDINGNPILNSAFDPYDPPIMINVPNQVLTVTRNEAAYDSAFAYMYRNSISQDSFAGATALFAKCIAITPKNLFHQDVGWYYQMTYEFELLNPRLSAGPNGWRKTILDAGLRQLVKGKPVHILLKGMPISQPMLLNGMGGLLAPNAAPVYNIYQVYPELPFSDFNFDVDAIQGTRTGFPGGGIGFGDPGST
jgi:hypothetical protein